MYLSSPLPVEIKDSLIDPDSNDRTARWRNPPNAKPSYRVFLYLDGPGLAFVSSVTYLLHPTFPDPKRQVFRTTSNPRCKLEIWTWGLFDLVAVVATKEGNTFSLTHELQYDKEFKDVKFVAA